jgi:hypothetical protein
MTPSYDAAQVFVAIALNAEIFQLPIAFGACHHPDLGAQYTPL